MGVHQGRKSPSSASICGRNTALTSGTFSSTRATAAYGSPWWRSSSRPSVQPHGFRASEFCRGHQFGHLRHCVCCSHTHLCHCVLRHRPPARRDPCHTPSSP
ncbi:hypothetical protein VPH35_059625 [Triticum aestivum]